jgi:hypothetical protein
MADQSGQIQTNGLAPQTASGDAGSMSQHPIAGQIAGDRYANARAGAKTVNRGLRFSKLIPAGPVSDQQSTNPATGGAFNQGD